MKPLQNKIDFVVLATVTNANPNGDPLNGNRPRTNFDGYGEISDVCIKRKIRNRLQDEGNNIFVQSADRSEDGYQSLSERAASEITDYKSKDDYAAISNDKWIDIRAFGQVFAFKASKEDKGKESVSVGVRGPVSIRQSVSVSPVEINSMQITKSVNGDPSEKKGSDTMGQKHFVEFGLYQIKGSISAQLSEKTGFTEDDAEKVKEALRTMFENDTSSARPDGSMEVTTVYWWKHNNKSGQYSSAKVHRSIEITLKDGVITPHSIEDYEIKYLPLEGLVPEIIEGF